MKTFYFVIALTLCSFQASAEDSWFDSLKAMLGFGETSEEVATENTAISAQSLVDYLAENLGVTSAQAEGGLAALFNFVKQSAESEQFAAISDAIPGLDTVLASLPKVSGGTAQVGLGGLLEKAAEYSDSIKAVSDVKKQFEALGLSPEMIGQFGEQVQQYLNTPEGEEAKRLVNDALSNLTL